VTGCSTVSNSSVIEGFIRVDGTQFNICRGTCHSIPLNTISKVLILLKTFVRTTICRKVELPQPPPFVFSWRNSKKLDQDEIIEILNQANARFPELHEVMVEANTNTFEMSNQESVSYFTHLVNLEKIRHTISTDLAKLLIGNKKRFFVKSSVGKSAKNPRSSII
jgi:hypothetical protein